MAAIWFTAAPTLIADGPGYPPRDANVRQAGGQVAPGVQVRGNAAQATYTEPMKPIEKPLMLPGPHKAVSAGEKTSSSSHAFGAIVTVFFSLAIVLGLFGLCAWLMRRGLPNNARTLPAEAVSVLGRAPLAGRQQMHLVRFGNKMLLVCISPTGVDSLGEITDPAEIDRLAGMCEQQQGTSATATFKHIFGQVARDRSPARWLSAKSATAKEAADV